jgi:hypothetical protein
MLFKIEHIAPILDGTKTQTRRLWKRPMVKVGGLYWAQTALYKSESRFARLKVLRLWQERLGDITEADARAEGYPSRADYFLAFRRINRLSGDVFDLHVYCVEFEVVETRGILP